IYHSVYFIFSIFMPLSEKILDFIKSKKRIEFASIQDLRNSILIILSTITIVSLIPFSITEFINGSNINAWVILGSLFVLSINLYLAYTKILLELTKYIYLGVVGLLCIYILIFPAKDIETILFITFPINAFFILPVKYGNRVSLGIFILSVIAMIVPVIINLNATLNTSLIIPLTVTYLAVHSIFYIYERLKQEYINDISEDVEKSKKNIAQKDKFLSKLSHQLRTPLNNIMVVTNLVNNVDLDQKQRDLIDTIQASANNLANVVNNISEFSTVEISESSEYNVDFDLFATINNTLKIFTQQNEENINFNVNIPEELKSDIKGNPIKIKQIFLNLIESILKNKTELEIKIDINIDILKKEGSKIKVLFEIISNQPLQAPINESKQKYISTIETSESEKQGDLINLLDIAIANRIVKLENEKIAIDISNDKTVFSFALNLIHGIKEEKEKPIPSEPSKGKLPKIPLNESNVLLVEDNIINQKIVILSLKKSVKNIDVANNGKEALDMFGTSKYDLILMDIQMPIMNGIVTTKKIREIESSSNTHTPIIAITANALLGDKENCLAAGMDDYISKPFQIEILLKKMESQLG
ncbi:response regulator, partial [Bacteroidota bacterium]